MSKGQACYYKDPKISTCFVREGSNRTGREEKETNTWSVLKRTETRNKAFASGENWEKYREDMVQEVKRSRLESRKLKPLHPIPLSPNHLLR